MICEAGIWGNDKCLGAASSGSRAPTIPSKSARAGRGLRGSACQLHAFSGKSPFTPCRFYPTADRLDRALPIAPPAEMALFQHRRVMRGSFETTLGSGQLSPLLLPGRLATSPHPRNLGPPATTCLTNLETKPFPFPPSKIETGSSDF